MLAELIKPAHFTTKRMQAVLTCDLLPHRNGYFTIYILNMKIIYKTHAFIENKQYELFLFVSSCVNDF
jgi:hypothetical protein